MMTITLLTSGPLAAMAGIIAFVLGFGLTLSALIWVLGAFATLLFCLTLSYIYSCNLDPSHSAPMG